MDKELPMPNVDLPKVTGKIGQTAGWLALALYILIAQVVAPLIGKISPSKTQTVTLSEERLLTLLETAAINRTNIDALRQGQVDTKTALERIERKVDIHINGK